MRSSIIFTILLSQLLFGCNPNPYNYPNKNHLGYNPITPAHQKSPHMKIRGASNIPPITQKNHSINIPATNTPPNQYRYAKKTPITSQYIAPQRQRAPQHQQLTPNIPHNKTPQLSQFKYPYKTFNNQQYNRNNTQAPQRQIINYNNKEQIFTYKANRSLARDNNQYQNDKKQLIITNNSRQRFDLLSKDYFSPDSKEKISQVNYRYPNRRSKILNNNNDVLLNDLNNNILNTIIKNDPLSNKFNIKNIPSL